jgi:hypothetical protein
MTALPVLTDEPYWIYPSVYSKDVKITPAKLGPFPPSSKIHVLDLALESLGPEERPASGAKDPSRCGSVRFTVSDGLTGSPIGKARVLAKKDRDSGFDFKRGDSMDSASPQGL